MKLSNVQNLPFFLISFLSPPPSPHSLSGALTPLSFLSPPLSPYLPSRPHPLPPSPSPKVLVVGGGDGGVLREVAKPLRLMRSVSFCSPANFCFSIIKLSSFFFFLLNTRTASSQGQQALPPTCKQLLAFPLQRSKFIFRMGQSSCSNVQDSLMPSSLTSLIPLVWTAGLLICKVNCSACTCIRICGQKMSFTWESGFARAY